MTPRIAVLDDQPRMLQMLEMVLRRAGFEVAAFARASALFEALEADAFDLLITDLRLEQTDGVTVLKAAQAAQPGLPVVLITAYASIKTAVEAMRSGAFDYVQKPFDNEHLVHVVQRALRVTALDRENRYLRAELGQRVGPDAIVAASPQMKAVLDLARRAGRSNSTVLISGPSGTGKEVVARAIHYLSDRVGRPFVAVNCRAFASGVVESELFGHERGAFTGAVRARAGVFEQAHGGTLFLDEIGETGPDFQAKLLRVLQEREVQRVGGSGSRPVDVRLLAATNIDLRGEVAAGRFREDLYFRLAVIPIELTPLSERPEDILPLASAFVERLARQMGRPPMALTEPVKQWLLGHPWPGNVRELHNIIERAVVLARSDVLEVSDMALGAGGPTLPATDRLQDHLDQATARHIQAVLARTGGKKADAARLLGIERTTLYRLIKRLALEQRSGD